MSPEFTEAQIAAFIEEEAPYHGGKLPRKKAIEFMGNREVAAAVNLGTEDTERVS